MSENNMESTARTVVFIHGLWMTPLCWEHFEEHFAAQGYHVMAPAWPGHDGDIGKVRDNAPTALAGLGLADIVSHFEKIVRPMDEQPILVGHSFGGLIVQILLDRGLGAAGIGMDSAPPKGVNRVPLAQLKASWPAIRRPANRHRVVALTFKQYKFGFANTMPEDEARRAYERYAVPDTARLLFQAALADLMRNAPTEIDYNDGLRKPLLLIAGGKDHTVPASVSKSNFHKYTHSSAVTDYHEFADRSHNIILEKGWEEVADYASEWLKDVLHLETMAEPVPDRDVLTSNRHTV